MATGRAVCPCLYSASVSASVAAPAKSVLVDILKVFAETPGLPARAQIQVAESASGVNLVLNLDHGPDASNLIFWQLLMRSLNNVFPHLWVILHSFKDFTLAA